MTMLVFIVLMQPEITLTCDTLIGVSVSFYLNVREELGRVLCISNEICFLRGQYVTTVRLE